VKKGFSLLPCACVALAIFTLAACKREDRGFRVSPPAPADTKGVRLSSLQPGNHQPDPEVKNEYEENAYAVSEGKRLFSAFNCVGCHGHGGGSMGPPLLDAKWIYGSRPEQVYATIVEGRPNGMPSFRGKIADHQIWQLAAYVRSLSGQIPNDVAPARDDHMKSNPPENSVDPLKPVPSTLPNSAQRPE
jgi:cytochrome c oxidase cbb3-type subunit III